jgi:peptidase C39-like protein
MPKISSRVILVLAVLATFAFYMLRTAHVGAADNECTPPKSRQLPVWLISQETDNWCWVASAQMVKTFLFKKVHPSQNPQFSQCDEASKVKGVDCCAASMPASCNAGGWPDFGDPDFTSIPSQRPPPSTPLSWATIKKEIGCARRPFVFAWKDVGGGGHMVVVVGYSEKNGAQRVQINDPLPLGKASFYGESYDWYAGESEDANKHWGALYEIQYIGP